ncbi:hypothetical protein BU25DRAFT_344866 [Macroventuria anomochaeta]|uniref:Uncharacterized protein n=1 Tax=Macroventuria anomochaeta TaxID=301207 RepID=A0ACB6RY43_9PLEO|nr:uncharacterized protein BU25DRAFT_344866 [Macroventuria anomochaeta]KAF2626063.1 hypothetical protein BU25DRAFT_344866 [Macroventuria anomochaeta]
MAEAVGLVASIIAVLDLSAKVLGYINAVKDASKDRARCGLEISNMHGLLEKLRFRAEQRNDSEAWYEAAKDLTKDGGLLDQFKQALDRLDHGLTEGGRLRRVAEALRWKFKKEEVLEIMTHLERLKSVMVVSLQMDQL